MWKCWAKGQRPSRNRRICLGLTAVQRNLAKRADSVDEHFEKPSWGLEIVLCLRRKADMWVRTVSYKPVERLALSKLARNLVTTHRERVLTKRRTLLGTGLDCSTKRNTDTSTPAAGAHKQVEYKECKVVFTQWVFFFFTNLLVFQVCAVFSCFKGKKNDGDNLIGLHPSRARPKAGECIF